MWIPYRSDVYTDAITQAPKSTSTITIEKGASHLFFAPSFLVQKKEKKMPGFRQISPLLRTFTRSQSNTIFSTSTITSKLPQVKLSSSTTLGEVWEGAFVKYKYRAVYPVLLWVGFLWYNLWTP